MQEKAIPIVPKILSLGISPMFDMLVECPSCKWMGKIVFCVFCIDSEGYCGCPECRTVVKEIYQ